MESYIETYKVYIKINENGIVTNINSSAFLPNIIIDADKWIKIDEGVGDRYCHAQGCYLPVGLIDNNGIFNYAFINGELIERTLDDKQPEIDKLNAFAEIELLKKKLAETDYICAKITEGAATREDYATKIAERAAWREQINKLEMLI